MTSRKKRSVGINGKETSMKKMRKKFIVSMFRVSAGDTEPFYSRTFVRKFSTYAVSEAQAINNVCFREGISCYPVDYANSSWWFDFEAEAANA